MAYILAVLTAALSFSVNRLLVKKWESQTIVALGPVVEEAAKTLPAYYLGVDIFIVHFLFGVIEGGLDFWQSENAGTGAAFLSVAAHASFGALTVLLLDFSGAVFALAGVAVVHIAWNAAVNRLAQKRR